MTNFIPFNFLSFVLGEDTEIDIDYSHMSLESWQNPEEVFEWFDTFAWSEYHHVDVRN
jgi:hypothetical protein